MLLFHKKNKPGHLDSIISQISPTKQAAARYFIKMKEKHTFFLLFSVGRSRPAKADFVLRGCLTFPQPFSQRYLSLAGDTTALFQPQFFFFAKSEMFRSSVEHAFLLLKINSEKWEENDQKLLLRNLWRTLKQLSNV